MYMIIVTLYNSKLLQGHCTDVMGRKPGKVLFSAADGQRRRAIEALEARAPPQYCDCGPDWPLLFKVHEI